MCIVLWSRAVHSLFSVLLSYHAYVMPAAQPALERGSIAAAGVLVTSLPRLPGSAQHAARTLVQVLQHVDEVGGLQAMMASTSGWHVVRSKTCFNHPFT